MEQLRWLLVGAGDIARKRVAAALKGSPLCRLEAVCGHSLQGAQDLAAQFGISKCFNNMEQALSENYVDAVYIATPVDSHISLGLIALRAGKHVLIEKPLGLNAPECLPLMQEAEQRQLIAGCAYYRRCSPRYHHVRELLHSGELGSLISVRMHYESWYDPATTEGLHWRVQPERSGGGPLADIGSHMFDLLVGLFGKPRVRSAAVYHRVHAYPAEDSAVVLAELPGEIPVTAEFHWCSRVWSHELEILGSESSIVWSPFDSGQVLKMVGRHRIPIDLPTPENPHLPLVEDFARAVLQKRPLACPVSEAVITNQVLDEIYSRASREKEPAS